MLTVGSLCSGIGGIDLAFERAGAKVIWNCEIDANCRKVLRHHWPGVPRFKDVKVVTGERLRAAGLVPDALVGGWPCQDLSVAGARAGLAGERSGLFFEFARIAEEAKPEWLVLENVPGALSAGCKPSCVGGCVATHGGAMGAILGTLADIGYYGAWRVLDAQYAGVPQRRRRLFFVFHLGDGRRAAQVLLEPEGGGGDPPARRAPGENVARSASNGAGGNGEIIPPVAGTPAEGSGNRGWCDDLDRATFIPHTVNGAVPDLSTARCSNRGQRNDHNEQTFLPVAFSQNGSDVQATGDRTACLRGEGSSSGNGGINVVLPVAFHMTQDPINGDVAPAIGGVKPTTGYATVGVAFSVAQRGRDGESVMELGEADLHNALRAGDGGSSRHQQILTPQLAVRRLLPVECLRLQAFPDDWLDGLGLADSTKYRMVGNSVCVNVVEWIARRMVAEHLKH